MRFSLKWLFGFMFAVALIAASFRLVTVEERHSDDAYVEYMGLSPQEVEQRLVGLLKKKGFKEVARWDPTLSAIPTEPPLRGGREKEAFVPIDRYFEKKIGRGKIGCALGVDLRYFNKGACLCYTRCYFSGRVRYWRWSPLDDRLEPTKQVSELSHFIMAHHLTAMTETSRVIFPESYAPQDQ
ncbi:hypothetical protein M4951_00125 [Blastopirellula sp. J2-11]|uniref:hypothetical protein n=1 Tax=Blastopirellula sp. J2-11 TaxID=2943192 RepID=UPI0021C6A72D|nr:hypothetical protein [Blastopirellula sp. J2-11]UUO06736.1 hypothetical protein M4951_00125 [Blastopirellula sp. J2-11]